jgi:uncharacterized protein with HEPN domain
MDNVKNDTYFANKIRDDLIFIVNYTKNIDEEELSKNEILLDSMMFRLIQISENAKRLSDEYKELLSSAKILCHPSNSDSSPNSLLE